jgi:hypothetical protein
MTTLEFIKRLHLMSSENIAAEKFYIKPSGCRGPECKFMGMVSQKTGFFEEIAMS